MHFEPQRTRPIHSYRFSMIPMPMAPPAMTACCAQARYANVQLKEGRSGTMLMVDIETEFRTEAGELLLINRQTLIWR
mgnify:CR=1 FL=1